MAAEDIITEISMRQGVKGDARGYTKSPVSVEVSKQTAIRLLAEGCGLRRAAELLGRDIATIRRWWRDDDEFKDKVKGLNSEAFAEIDEGIKQRAQAIHQRLAGAAEEALDKVLDLMNNANSETIQMRCAMDVLDRNSTTSKVHKIDKREIRVNIDSKFLEAAAIADAELGSSAELNGEVLNAS